MDYIRWIILGWEDALFGQGVIIPVLVFSAMAVGISFAIHVIIGFAMLTIALIFLGLIAYVFIEKYSKIHYKKFLKATEKAEE